MKYLLLLTVLTVSQLATAKFKFNYGDQVKVHSNAWNKPCYNDEFYNVCGMVGTIVDYGDYNNKDKTCVYKVSFKYPDGKVLEQVYHEVHLKKIK